jgi:hypothetical protein
MFTSATLTAKHVARKLETGDDAPVHGGLSDGVRERE